MKIIHLSLTTDLGTCEATRTHTLGIAKNMASLGNEVNLVVARNKEAHNKYRLKIFAIEYKSAIGKENYFSIFSTLIKNNLLHWLFLKDLNNYDVIYERYIVGYFSGLIFSKMRGIPLVYEVNGIPDEELFNLFNTKNFFIKKIISKFIKFQLRHSNKIVVQTKELKKIIQSKFDINNIEVVPNGADIYNLPNKEKNSIFKMSYIGALSYLHNLDQVFESISSLREKFIFFIVGDGNLFNKYKLMYKGDERFIFKGQLSHEKALKIIKESDLCIASNSKKDSLFKKYGFYLCPLKLLEYSMAGRPTILFESSNSFTKLFERNNACFIVNSKDEFTKKLRILIKDSKLRKKMGENARKLVEKEFTWMKSAEKTETILKQVLKEHSKK